MKIWYRKCKSSDWIWVENTSPPPVEGDSGKGGTHVIQFGYEFGAFYGAGVQEYRLEDDIYERT